MQAIAAAAETAEYQGFFTLQSAVMVTPPPQYGVSGRSHRKATSRGHSRGA